MNKTFIISIQKSGTYLLSEILGNIGYNKSLIHLNKKLSNLHQKYDGGDIEKSRTNFRAYNFELDPEKIINSLNNNEFAVGHLYFSEKAKKLLKKHKCIFTIRNLKTALISFMKWKQESLRIYDIDKKTWMSREDDKEKFFYYVKVYGKNYFNTCKQILPWINENLLVVRYENLIDPNKNESELCIIADYLDVNLSYPKEILRKSFEKKTITKSSTKTELSTYWSNSTNELFGILGGNELNKKFGYNDQE
jgi:hypothetical protein